MKSAAGTPAARRVTVASARRQFGVLIAACLLAEPGIVVAALVPSSAAPAERGRAHAQAAPVVGVALRVTLLGTGTPTPDPERSGPGVLVQANGMALVFDAGRGVAGRLVQAGLRLDRIDAVFLTHLHFDHVIGLADLMLTSRMPADYGLRTRPLTLYGPRGTLALARGIETAYDGDIELRSKAQGLSPDVARFAAGEFSADGVVFERGGVSVRAFEVDHGDGPGTSYGFRIDAGGRSVVISGDTTFDERVIAAARNVDLLIHEVLDIPAEYQKRFPAMVGVTRVHTTPEQAGRVFTRARPRLAVYTHLALIGGGSIRDVVSRTRSTYTGPLMVGEDLMSFEIGEAIGVFRDDPGHLDAYTDEER